VGLGVGRGVGLFVGEGVGSFVGIGVESSVGSAVGAQISYLIHDCKLLGPNRAMQQSSTVSYNSKVPEAGTSLFVHPSMMEKCHLRPLQLVGAGVVGIAVGSLVGAGVGLAVGFEDGSLVGLGVGRGEGLFVGEGVGSSVGEGVGPTVGKRVGSFVGVGVGLSVVAHTSFLTHPSNWPNRTLQQSSRES